MIDKWKLILTDTLYFWYPIFLISDTLYFWYPIFLIPDIFPIPNISDTRYIWYGTWYFWYPIFIIPNINDIRYFCYFWCMNLFLMPNRGHYYDACAIFLNSPKYHKFLFKIKWRVVSIIPWSGKWQNVENVVSVE